MDRIKATPGNVSIDVSDPKFREAADADLRQFVMWLMQHAKSTNLS